MSTQPPPYAAGYAGAGGPPYPPAEGFPPSGTNPAPGGYPPPQGAHASPQGGYPVQNLPSGAYSTQSQTTVIVTRPALHGGVFGETPMRTKCQHCDQEITTCTAYENGMMTWVAVGVILLVGCWCGCCLIPFCVDSCKDVVHTCPNCHQVVGRYKPLS